MSRLIFVNLPVKDLDRSMAFFRALGLEFNPDFTDERAACLVFSDDIYAMLLTEPFFATFTPKPVADATKATEVMTALSADSREAVDALVGKAVKAGGTEAHEPIDHGFMYERLFSDPDGHVWAIVWMDTAQMDAARGAA